ncbi:MAG: UPF0182 family protein, partial [Microbacteriaceae bacterium]|nr:UPF0182 family protein [Microbacteriaceae bacterium]
MTLTANAEKDPRKSPKSGGSQGSGSARAGKGAAAGGGKKGRVVFFLTAALFVVILIGLLAAGNVYTDVLWFQQLGFERVIFTQWLAIGALFGSAFVFTVFLVAVNMQIVYRKRPAYAKISSHLQQYQNVLDPLWKFARWAVPLVCGVFAGVSASSHWQRVLLFLNSEPTGQKDALNGFDLQFFLFALPVYSGFVEFLQAVLLLCLVLVAVISYVYGGIAITGKDLRISKATRRQLAILIAAYGLCMAAGVWLGQYRALTNSKGVITGASYADVHGFIPGVQILAAIIGLVAVLFIVTAVTGKWRVSIMGTALTVLAALLLGSGYPWALQQFKVRPDEKSIEAEYIAHNIAATRAAYGIDKVEVQRYEAVTSAAPGALRDDAVATSNVRLMDPSIVSSTFAQLEQAKQYYKFDENLSVDRYNIDGRVEDTVSAPREIDVSGQSGWYNRTLVYTHGYGLVAAYGNQRAAGGEPVFLENGIPTSGKLGKFEPRIYFGRNSPVYSVVGGKRDKPIEVDYPADTKPIAQASAAEPGKSNDTEKKPQAENAEKQNLTTFQGNGGPVLHGFFEKLLYSLKFQDMELMLSGAVVDGSQILYRRDPLERVAAVAPYLTLDRQPYASVIDGKVVWIVDGYTTSDAFPYARQSNMNELLTDAETKNNGKAPSRFNYIRNSVKATVDAYDGSVKLYAWDKNDPILKAWNKIYPGTLREVSEMSADLLSHVRYPNDLFKVQREILAEYHVTEPGAFYSKEDAWRTPDDPVSAASASSASQAATQQAQQRGSRGGAEPVRARSAVPAQPPYYLTLSAGKGQEPNFSIYSTFIPMP